MVDTFEHYLGCGDLAGGFLRCRCEGCGHDVLVAFSCKNRGLCPSCGARRMCNEAAQIVDRVLPDVPVRQWVLSLPWELRGLAAMKPGVLGAMATGGYRSLDFKKPFEIAIRLAAGERRFFSLPVPSPVPTRLRAHRTPPACARPTGCPRIDEVAPLLLAARFDIWTGNEAVFDAALGVLDDFHRRHGCIRGVKLY